MGSKEGSSKAAFDQRIARAVARPLARTPLTPNLVTAGGLAVGLVAAWLMARGGGAASAGAALFMVAVWIDHLDGELARATGRSSEFGHYFDHVAAMTTYVAMFVGAGIGLRRGSLGDGAIVLGVVAGISVAAIMSVRMWLETRAGREAVRQRARAGFEIEDTLYVVGPITWFGALQPFIVAAGIGAPLFLFYVVWDAVRRLRRDGISAERR